MRPNARSVLTALRQDQHCRLAGMASHTHSQYNCPTVLYSVHAVHSVSLSYKIGRRLCPDVSLACLRCACASSRKIATGHGPLLRYNVSELMGRYEAWEQVGHREADRQHRCALRRGLRVQRPPLAGAKRGVGGGGGKGWIAGGRGEGGCGGCRGGSERGEVAGVEARMLFSFFCAPDRRICSPSIASR